MRKSRFSVEQIVAVLKEQEAVSDNGTEFTSTAMLRWQQESGANWH